MSQQVVITITTGTEAVNTIKGEFIKPTSDQREEARSISNYFVAAGSGLRACSFDVQLNGGTGVAASGTITNTAIVAADTVTVGGVVFTAVSSGPTGNQFVVGTTTQTSTNLAAAINAATALKGVVTATSATNVVTVTAAVKGLIGNTIGLAISAHGTVSGAFLTGGVAIAPNVYHLGL